MEFSTPRYQNTWFADFETTTKPQYLRDGFTRVWLWYIENLKNENGEIGLSGHDFLSFLINEKGNHKVYFHNLVKFDGEFIWWILLNAGYKPVNYEHELEENTFFRNRDGYGLDYWYTLKIKNQFKKRENEQKYRFITFRCSLLLLNDSVERLSELSNKFKKELSVNKFMHEFHDEKTLDEIKPEWIKRVKSDVKIIKEAFINFKKMCNNRISLTKASTAFTDFKLFNKQYEQEIKNNITYEENLNFHKWYRGAYNYPNPIYQNKKLKGPIYVYDVNSLYPSCMQMFPMPYGKPIYGCGQSIRGWESCKTHNFQLLEVMISKAKIKKGKMPFLTIKDNFKNDYISEVKELTLFNLTNIDLNMVLRDYEKVEYTIVNRYCFNSKLGIFDKYINKWYKLKIISKSGSYRYNLAKLMLNSLYGKFGSKCERTRKIYTYINGKYQESEVTEIDKENVYYNPIAIAITSYARMYTINDIQKDPTNFIYADTDSIHTFKKPEGMKIHETILGYWKFEGQFDEGKYLKNKQYLLKNEIETMRKIAGLSKDNHKLLNLDNFNENTIIEAGKRMKKRVKGGIILDETDFKLNSPDDDSLTLQTYIKNI